MHTQTAQRAAIRWKAGTYYTWTMEVRATPSFTSSPDAVSTTCRIVVNYDWSSAAPTCPSSSPPDSSTNPSPSPGGTAPLRIVP